MQRSHSQEGVTPLDYAQKALPALYEAIVKVRGGGGEWKCKDNYCSFKSGVFEVSDNNVRGVLTRHWIGCWQSPFATIVSVVELTRTPSPPVLRWLLVIVACFVCLECQIILFVISTFTPIFFIEIFFVLLPTYPQDLIIFRRKRTEKTASSPQKMSRGGGGGNPFLAWELRLHSNLKMTKFLEKSSKCSFPKRLNSR